MIASFISPPIYVDTRSSTRDIQEKKDQKNLFGYINPFSSSDLSRIFINKSKRDGNYTHTFGIDDSMEGLYNYLTASNIKNKIKHPVFLAIKFPQTLRLFYNSVSFEENKSNVVEEVIWRLQKFLFSAKTSHMPYQRIKVEGADIKNSSFALLISDSQNMNTLQLQKNIDKYMKPMKQAGISIIYKEDYIPSTFIALEKDMLTMKYTNISCQLFNSRTSSDPNNEITEYGSNPLSRNVDTTQNGKKKATYRFSDTSVVSDFSLQSNTQKTPFNILNDINTNNIPETFITQEPQAEYPSLNSFTDIINNIRINYSHVFSDFMKNKDNIACTIPFKMVNSSSSDNNTIVINDTSLFLRSLTTVYQAQEIITQQLISHIKDMINST